MSAILKTDAIVLRNYRLGETSKIVILYTRKFGKIRVVAKGSRKTKSKFGGNLELFAHISVVFYKKDTRELQVLSESSLIRPFLKIREDLTKLSIVSAILELLNYAVPFEETNTIMFKLLFHSLEVLNDAEKNLMNLFYFFQFHLSTLLGYKLFFHQCTFCHNTIGRETVKFHMDLGAVSCESCADQSHTGYNLSIESVKILERLQISTAENVFSIHPSRKAEFEILDLLTRYFKYHIDGINDLKSLEVLKEMNKELK